MSLLAYVGCRTTRERNARGEGIRAFRMPGHGAGWEPLQTLPTLPNPSYLAVDAARSRLYAVHGDFGEVSAYAIGSGGSLAPIGQRNTGGRNPVHLSLLPGGHALAIANYATGTVAVLGLDEHGISAASPRLVELPGEIGPHRVEQKGSQPHQVVPDPDGRWLLVPDKGLDRVFALPIARDGRDLGDPVVALETRECAGPRHLAFAPAPLSDGTRAVWVVGELDSTVMACRFDGATGRLHPTQVVSLLPEEFVGASRGAAIVASTDGRSVTATNRGHDSIVRFDADPATGRLSSPRWIDAGGRTPRFLGTLPDGEALVVALEQSDTLRVLRPEHAGLHFAGPPVTTGSPVCVVFHEYP